MKLLYQRILSDFPQNGLRSAFAYGSCVYKQIGQASGLSDMIDFVFVVDNPLEWHKENLLVHKDHYSWLRLGGVNLVNSIHRKSWPGVYFNTLVPWQSHLIKYGIVSTDSVISDLINWDHIYISGRLHKPVEWMKTSINDSDILDSTDQIILMSRQKNLVSAVCTALLTLPETFSEDELYTTICGLSYEGDHRMTFGEDKDKVRRIVWGHESAFRRLYGPVLNELPQVDWRAAYSDLLMRDCSLEGHRTLVNHLPSTVIRYAQPYLGSLAKNETDGWLRDRLAEHPQRSVIIKKTLRAIVSKSSIRQTISSFITAGFYKSTQYSFRKLWKMMASGTL